MRHLCHTTHKKRYKCRTPNVEKHLLRYLSRVRSCRISSRAGLDKFFVLGFKQRVHFILSLYFFFRISTIFFAKFRLLEPSGKNLSIR